MNSDIMNLDNQLSEFLSSISGPIVDRKIDRIEVADDMSNNWWIIDEIARTIYISQFIFTKLLLSIPKESNARIAGTPISSIFGIPLVNAIGAYE